MSFTAYSGLRSNLNRLLCNLQQLTKTKKHRFRSLCDYYCSLVCPLYTMLNHYCLSVITMNDFLARRIPSLECTNFTVFFSTRCVVFVTQRGFAIQLPIATSITFYEFLEYTQSWKRTTKISPHSTNVFNPPRINADLQ